MKRNWRKLLAIALVLEGEKVSHFKAQEGEAEGSLDAALQSPPSWPYSGGHNASLLHIC